MSLAVRRSTSDGVQGRLLLALVLWLGLLIDFAQQQS